MLGDRPSLALRDKLVVLRVWFAAQDRLVHATLQAGFPTIEQLGLFKLEAWGAPLWIYQASS